MQATPTISPSLRRDIENAAVRIRDGHIVAFPTETVYGLGADATNGEAIAKIFETKRRPSFNPLIVHVLDLDAAAEVARIPDAARKLADAYWPGPLTLVLPAHPGNRISSLVTAGLDSLAIRIPAHPVARELLATSNRPIAAPSANRSGRISPTRADHVAADFGADAPLILDGGQCQTGLESTIVDLTNDHPVILRPGAILREDLEVTLARPLGQTSPSDQNKPTAPGQLASHYAPVAPVRLNASNVNDGEALLGLGDNMPHTTGPAVNLSASGNLHQAAANLFDALRQVDQPDIQAIAVVPIPSTGIGEAINDRLSRAAAPRE